MDEHFENGTQNTQGMPNEPTANPENNFNTQMNTGASSFNNPTATNTPNWNTSPNTFPQSQNQFNNNSSYNNYGTPDFNQTPNGFNPYQSSMPIANKKSSKVGKTLFAALIVVCIIIASVFIGTTISGNSNKTQQSGVQTENKNNSSNAALPNVEESPYDVEKYSGKGPMTPAQIYEEVKESNVGILVYYQNQRAGEGTGVIVGEDKDKKYTYIITCAHVIAENGVDVQVQFSDSEEYPATIVGYDTKTDIGVLRVEKTGFKAVTFGDSSSLTVGTPVYAVGNPGGTVFFGSLTDGIISALDRPIATSANSYYDLPCIQHTAAINPGNSGGMLLNEFGQVIGINSSKISDTDYEGMGFAVPSEKVLEIYKQIVKYGYVTNRPMLGITYYSVASDYTYSAIAWKNDLPYGSIVINSISSNSGVNNTQIREGDIITAVNGKELQDTSILLEVIENSKVGDKITLTVVRLTNNGTIASTFDAEVELVEDKNNTVYSENSNNQNNQNSDYSQQNPFNPFGN